MKDFFKTLATNYTDVATRMVVITLLSFTDKYVHAFIQDLMSVFAFFGNVFYSKEQASEFITNTISNMGKDPMSYNEVFNRYIEEGRIVLIKDLLNYIEQNKAS